MDAIQAFLDTLTAEHTQRAYRTDLTKFVAHVGADQADFDAAAVRPTDVQAFLQSMRKSDLAEATRRRRLSAIRQFYDWLIEQDNVSQNPARGSTVRLRVKEKSTTSPEFLNEEELQALVSSAGESSISGTRDQGLILVILYAALRRSEVAALNFEHVRPLGRHWVIDVPSPSGARGGFVKIPDLVVTATQRVADAYGDDSGPLWRSYSNRSRGDRMSPDAIYKCVRTAGQDAGLGSVDIETVRRSGLRLASESGAHPAHIQSHARLQALASSMRFFDADSEDAGLSTTAVDFVELDLEL